MQTEQTCERMGQGRQPPKAVARSASLEANRSQGYFQTQLLPGDRLSCHRRLADNSAKLDASTGASGPHAFAVRFRRARLFAPSASTATRFALVTLRNAPPSEAGWDAI